MLINSTKDLIDHEAWDEGTRGVNSEQVKWRELWERKLKVENERIRDTIEQMFELQAASNPQAAPAAQGQPAAAATPGPIQEAITK